MYTSFIEFQLKPGKMAEATEIAGAMRSDLEQLDGLKQFIIIDKGDDAGLVLAMYESQAQQEAAGPKARELLGRLADLYAAAPERKGCEVTINQTF